MQHALLEATTGVRRRLVASASHWRSRRCTHAVAAWPPAHRFCLPRPRSAHRNLLATGLIATRDREGGVTREEADAWLKALLGLGPGMEAEDPGPSAYLESVEQLLSASNTGLLPRLKGIKGLQAPEYSAILNGEHMAHPITSVVAQSNGSGGTSVAPPSQPPLARASQFLPAMVPQALPH